MEVIMAAGPKGNDDLLYSDRWERMKKRLRQSSAAVYRSLERPETFSVLVTEIRVRFPDAALGEYMVVLKGVSDEGKHVAFYRADDYESAVTGALLAWENGSLKWREDRPWGQ
jgi:hypothetical protein